MLLLFNKNYSTSNLASSSCITPVVIFNRILFLLGFCGGSLRYQFIETGVFASNSVYDNTGGHIGLRSHRYEHLCFELSHHLADYDRRRDAEALVNFLSTVASGSVKTLSRLY